MRIVEQFTPGKDKISWLGPDRRRNRVRREKVMVLSGSQTRSGTGSFHPVAIRAAVEVTKLLKPLVQKVVQLAAPPKLALVGT